MYLRFGVSAGGAVEIETTPNLVLLLHGDGVDAGTTLTDDGDETMTFSLTGATQMDTAQKKFGTASILFNGSGRVGVLGPAGELHPTQYDLGASPDAIIDFWVRPSVLPPVNPEHLFGYEKNAPNWWRIAINTDGTIRFERTDSSVQTLLLTTTTAAVVNTWSHVIVSFHGGVTTIGIDGNLEDSGADVGSYDFTAGGSLGNAVIGGAAVSGDPLNGWLDEIRFKTGAYLSETDGPYTIPESAYV